MGPQGRDLKYWPHSSLRDGGLLARGAAGDDLGPTKKEIQGLADLFTGGLSAQLGEHVGGWDEREGGEVASVEE
jgi:hypothetical protein